LRATTIAIEKKIAIFIGIRGASLEGIDGSAIHLNWISAAKIKTLSDTKMPKIGLFLGTGKIAYFKN
jgi:hypothetical protein